MEQLEGALALGQNSASYEWLMGFNEPWTHITGEITATAWAQWMQPLAEKLGLKLVSPTINVANVGWSADFLNACAAEAENPDFPCNVHAIAAISIHDYACNSNTVTQRYAPKTG